MQTHLLNLTAFFLCTTFSLSANAALSNEALAKAMAKGSKTESQNAIASAVLKYTQSLSACESLLAGSSPKSTVEVLNQAPSWLIEAANAAYLKNDELDLASLASLRNHSFLVNVDIQKSGDLGERGGDDLEKNIRMALLDASPMGPALGQKLAIDIRNLAADSLENTLSFKLSLTFDNGQNLVLQFRNVSVGIQARSAVVARIVVASVFSRELLASEDRLRQEINALAYDLKKLLRVASPSVQVKVAALIQSLESAQPKKGLLSGFLTGSTMFRGGDTIMGDAFLACLNAKDEVLQMAQQMKQDEFKNVLGPQAPKASVAYVERPQNVMNRGRLANGYLAPRRLPETARERRERDERSGFETFLWIYDPFYMFSHPWYWGSRSGSFMNYWMMFDWMSEQQREANQAQSRFYHEPYTPEQMQRFDQPVTPIYTRDVERPFVDAWDRQVPVTEQILPVIDANGGTSWTNSRGQEIDVYEVADSTVQQRWSEATGETPAPTTGGVSERVLESPADQSAFTSGNGGSGWSAPASERDDSIKGY